MKHGNGDRNMLSMKWRQQRGRVEAWYATISDPGSHSGFWVHTELISPPSATSTPFMHGWAALFRKGKLPIMERYGPVQIDSIDSAGSVQGKGGSADPFSLAGSSSPSSSAIPSVSGTTMSPSRLSGTLQQLQWDLALDNESAASPLFTFPAWAWSRELLPGAQVVPVPSASVSGKIYLEGTPFELSGDARGNLAHIYSHSNSKKWGWLHAELGGGNVLEIVSAVPTRPGLSALPPFTLLQLRLGGTDWPRDSMLAAPLFKSSLGLPHWSVNGTVGHWRIKVNVTIPGTEALAVAYQDPDGSPATCTNCEVADAEITLERKSASGWEVTGRWMLDGCAHAEIGDRP
ncbi:MAG: hypothetical protein ACYDGY_05645 [Acidimicrobiales bacterium]